MALFLYANRSDEIGKRLERVLKTSSNRLDIQVCRTINSLEQKLRQFKPKNSFSIAILLALSKGDLSEIYSLRDLFWDIRIILILPDDEKETITKGHKLYPRFVSYIDRDFKDVAAVLEKMLKYLGSKIIQLKGDEMEWQN